MSHGLDLAGLLPNSSEHYTEIGYRELFQPPPPTTPTLFFSSMAKIRRIVLDVLKPHQPNVVDFATSLADIAARCHIKIIVTEVDKKTENIILELAGDDIRFEMINEEIKKLGATVHSIDEVEVEGGPVESGES